MQSSNFLKMETREGAEPFDSETRNRIKKILVIDHLPDWLEFFEDAMTDILPEARVAKVSLGMDVELINKNTGKIRATSWSLVGENGYKAETVNEFHPDLHVISLHLPSENGAKIHKRLGSPENTIFWTDLADDKRYLAELGLTESNLIADKYAGNNAAEFKRLITEMLRRQEA